MKNIFFSFFLACSFISSSGQLPFKYDSLYKTIYAKDLCRMMKDNPNLLLVDVRSAGEYNDTSQYASLNQGRLKGAVNISIDSITKDVSVLNPYKDKTLVFYCSHSQRSRRVSKLLTETGGYKEFYNLNGGMSVMNHLKEDDFPCKENFIVSNLPYKNYTFDQTAALLKSGKDLVILDARSREQFDSKDTVAENNIGRIRGAVHFPLADMDKRMSELAGKKDKTILVYSASGDGDGARIAARLVAGGYKNVLHLLGGINSFAASQEDISFLENPSTFRLLNADWTLFMIEHNTNLVIYDTRPTEEYDNKITGMTAYKNLGHIRNSIHVSESSFGVQPLPNDKSVPVLVYGNSEAGRFAELLCSKGFSHVYLLDSFYDFVWSGFNVENCQDNKKYLSDHNGLY